MAWGFLFSVSKSTGGKKRERCQSHEEVVGFDSLQELSCLLPVAPFRGAFLGIYLDFSCILLLLSLSRRIHETPAASRATGTLSHTSLSTTGELCEGEWGRNKRVSYSCSNCKPSQAHRAPCLVATVSWGLIRGTDEPCGQGCPGWVCETWADSLGGELGTSACPGVPLTLTAWCAWMWELCSSHSHLLRVLHASGEHKLACFDLLNTLLLNLKQRSGVPSKFFLPKCGKSASAGTLYRQILPWVCQGWGTEAPSACGFGQHKVVLELCSYLRAWHCSWRMRDLENCSRVCQ